VAQNSYQDIFNATQGKGVMHVTVTNETDKITHLMINVCLIHSQLGLDRELSSKYHINWGNDAEILPHQSAKIALVKPLMGIYPNYKIERDTIVPIIDDKQVMVTIRMGIVRKFQIFPTKYLTGTLFLDILDTEFVITN
jgi:hypothetical protein